MDGNTRHSTHPGVTVQPVVLAGGGSTQLWPLSRAAYPKQLLTLHGDRTLLQETLGRAERLKAQCAAGHGGLALRVADALVVCHEAHRHLIAGQLTDEALRASELLLEPVSRGTAPAVTIAALAARGRKNGSTGEPAPDPVLLIMPADHVIQDLDAWDQAVRAGAMLASTEKIVAFGVVPTRAETAYGYIRKGAQVGANGEGCALEAFVEKPDLDTAQSYLSAGKYLWNSGVYMTRASVWLDIIAIADERIARACDEAYREGTRDGQFFRVDAAAFAGNPTVSIDHGVMERMVDASGSGNWRTRDGRAIRAAMVPLKAGWSDVGAWPSLLETSCNDASGNVLRGDVQALDTEGSVLVSTRRLLCAVGVSNLIAVETADAVLVVDRDRAADVPTLVEDLRRAGRAEADSHARVYRPWGDYESLDAGDRYQVKRLTVKPGEVLSLQMHHHRAEHWVVVQGTAKVTRGEEVFLLTENESTYIPVGTKHRLENPGTVPLEIIEVQSGTYLGEDDIVRFEDRYNRVGES